MDAAKRKADTPREHTQSTDSSDDDRDDFVDDPKLTEAGVQRRRDKDAKRRKENCCANMAEAQPAIRDAIRSLPAPAPEFLPNTSAASAASYSAEEEELPQFGAGIRVGFVRGHSIGAWAS